MDIRNEDIFIKSYDGHFLDFILKNGIPLITDYHSLDREIVLLEDNSGIKLGGKKNRKTIITIDELNRTFKDLILAAIENFKSNSMFEIVGSSVICNGEDRHSVTPLGTYSYYLDFNSIKKELLVEQLIFDILFDKYLNEAEKMTLFGYSKHISSMLYADITLKTTSVDTISKKLKSSMNHNYQMINNSAELQEDLNKLGVDLEWFKKYFNPIAKSNSKNKKPKYVWDYFYYNRNMITYRQYRREFKKDGNYSYEKFISDLNEYNDFVMKLLPIDNESPKKYFIKSMDYYYLESYKRIDFICKLANTMPEKVFKKIDRECSLVKRFHPCVSILYEKNNELHFASKYKYYRPFFMIEDEFHEHILVSNKFDQSIYADQLLKYHIIRAKAYELFKYHCEYVSSDYSDIKNFIRQSYNMSSFHESNRVWEIIKNNSWNDMDDETKQQVKIFYKNFISVNKALFWESPKRRIQHPNE